MQLRHKKKKIEKIRKVKILKAERLVYKQGECEKLTLMAIQLYRDEEAFGT